MRIIICILFALAGLTSNAQPEFRKVPPGPTHKFGDLIIYASPGLLGNRFSGGIKGQFFLTRHLSLDADMVFSSHYFHGPGIIPVGVLLLDSERDSWGYFKYSLAAIASAFEHISYHIPLKDGTQLAPYVSLYRYRYSKRLQNSEDGLPLFDDEQVSFAAGVQLNKYFGKFVMSPFGEYSIGYKDNVSCLYLGVSLGYFFMGEL